MTVSALVSLKTVLQFLARAAEGPLRLAFLGYPDIAVPDHAYIEMFGPGALDRLVSRPNQEKIIQVHGATQAGVTRVPTLESVLGLMTDRTVAFDILDIALYAGNEIICDMNEPVPEEFHQCYDLVWDGGTLEHVFDISQGLMNCAKMCRKDGFVFHILPINWFNHGFYNINPTLLVDFHEDNGFQTAALKGSDNPWSSAAFDLPAFDRFQLDKQVMLFYLARRIEIRERFTKPIQRRYRDPSLWC